MRIIEYRWNLSFKKNDAILINDF